MSNNFLPVPEYDVISSILKTRWALDGRAMHTLRQHRSLIRQVFMDVLVISTPPHGDLLELCQLLGYRQARQNDGESTVITINDILKETMAQGEKKEPNIYEKGEGSHRPSDLAGDLIQRFWNTRLSERTAPAAEVPDSERTPPPTKVRGGEKLNWSRESRESNATSSTNDSADEKLTVHWSVQDEIAKIFKPSLESALCRWEEGVSCSISPCPKEDGDYLCTSVAKTWPELRKISSFRGPIEAGLNVRRNVILRDTNGMIERCVVCGPGYLMFNLSMKWIAKGIHRMVKDLDISAPKLAVDRAILYFLTAENMNSGHLRSTFIGEALARILEYSRVEVIRRFHEEDVIEVLYMESKVFIEYAEFREMVQRLRSQGWDERHKIAWLQSFKKSRERNQEVYERLGVHVKEEVSGFDPFDSHIIDTLDLPREIESERDEAIFLERLKISVYISALWHALNVLNTDWILHVTDVGQRDHFEMCISTIKGAGYVVKDPYPLSHIGFGRVHADGYERLLDEAKIRCKTVLVGQGKADEWTAEELEDTAEALGDGAVKYAVLKCNRLTEFTINFDEILNEKGNTVVYLHYTHAQVCSIITKNREGIYRLKKLKKKDLELLTLKNNEERELGLHVLRFTEVLGEVCTLLMPHILCEYLYDLCKKFDSFYSSASQVVGRGDLLLCEATEQVYSSASQVVGRGDLLLCEATEQVMRKCFHLLAITPIHEKIIKLLRLDSKLSRRFYFSDLTEQQLMDIFCKGPCYRFDLCKVVLSHKIDDDVEVRTSYDKLILFGVIQAETHISDPSHYGFNIFNHNLDNPLVIAKPGSSSPLAICYCSLSVSTFVKITAKLYGTTYKGDGMECESEYEHYYPPNESEDTYQARFREYMDTGSITSSLDEKVYLDDDAVDICDDNVFINFSEYFANIPNGGSGHSKLVGKDGYLDLYYVALKYAVEANLEVCFVAKSKETKVFGRVMAYYGNNFSYDCRASERYMYNAMLFEIKPPSHIEPGKINLMRSALGVPAQYSLIIDAKLWDFTSGDMILSSVCEFLVPVDGSSSVSFINGKGCSLKVKVDWKLPI